MPAHVRVNSHREAKIVVLAVEIIKVVSPQLLDVFGIHPSVTVGRFFDEHHRWQVVEVPIGWDLDQTGMRAGNEGFHPVRRVFAVIDWGPGVAGAEPIGEAVVVGKAVVCKLQVSRGAT